MTVGLFLLGATSGSLAMFIVCGALIGLGLSALLGAPIRYITLNETGASERSAAQGLVATFTSMGQLLGSAVVGAVAASRSTPAAGYTAAFGMVGALGVALLATALLLKSRAAEAHPASAGRASHA
jgi:MFS family permease